MSARIDAERREDARAAAIERAKEVQRFDASVTRAFAEGMSVRETATHLGVSPSKVMASRVWLGLEVAGLGRVRRNSGMVRSLKEAAE